MKSFTALLTFAMYAAFAHGSPLSGIGWTDKGSTGDIRACVDAAEPGTIYITPNSVTVDDEKALPNKQAESFPYLTVKYSTLGIYKGTTKVHDFLAAGPISGTDFADIDSDDDKYYVHIGATFGDADMSMQLTGYQFVAKKSFEYSTITGDDAAKTEYCLNGFDAAACPKKSVSPGHYKFSFAAVAGGSKWQKPDAADYAIHVGQTVELNNVDSTKVGVFYNGDQTVTKPPTTGLTSVTVYNKDDTTQGFTFEFATKYNYNAKSFNDAVIGGEIVNDKLQVNYNFPVTTDFDAGHFVLYDPEISMQTVTVASDNSAASVAASVAVVAAAVTAAFRMW